MNSKIKLPISEAGKNISHITEAVQKGKTYFLTSRGRSKAVIMSMDEFESLWETIEVLETFPDIMEDIRDMEKDIESNNIKSYKSLKEFKAELRISDGAKKKYDVSKIPSSKSRKRSKKSR